MTVCIAALCDNGRGCVLVADQMITAHIPIGYEFENDEVSKIADVADSTYVLIAGDVIFADEVIRRARARIKSDGIVQFAQIADTFREAYRDVRLQHIIRNEFEPRGLSLNAYYSNQQGLAPGLVDALDRALRGSDPGVDLIIAGKDDDGCCRITMIQNPGDSFSSDSIGFVTTGSGGPHATYSLIESNYRKSMSRDEVRDLVCKAKKRSEVAPGVGSETRTIEV